MLYMTRSSSFRFPSSQEANIIAHRTRSKLTIDKPLEAIEASFIAPDAEHDMYDVYESDHEDIEWKKWLSSLYRTEGGCFDFP